MTNTREALIGETRYALKDVKRKVKELANYIEGICIMIKLKFFDPKAYASQV